MAHKADGASVSGRMEPRPEKGVTHAVRLAPDLEFKGHAMHGVIRMTCAPGCTEPDGRPWRRTLEDGKGYALEDIVRVATMHEQGA